MPCKLYELRSVNDVHPSPYCWCIRMSLAHKRLESAFVTVRFGQKDEIAPSVYSQFPVLDDVGRVIQHLG